MRKLFSASPLALCVLGALALYGCSGNGPAGLTESMPVDQAPPTAQTQHANGVVEDWNTRHVIYPRVGNPNTMMALQHDVRALQSWQLAARNALLRSRVPPRFLPIQSDAHRDWSISPGGGSVAPSMYPAKFGFSISSTVTAANCTSDFAVFPIDVAGGGGQPNIVGLDNLYSGTVPSNGICNRTATGSDTGVAATVLWSYNVTGTGGGGIVATSPTLSLDGTKVAFVETGGGAARFHVLAWKSGDGVDAGNLQSVTLGPPKQLTGSFATAAPVAGSGTVTDLGFGSE